MSLPFESVREQLLRNGVTASYANRYVSELRDHLQDIVDNECASGSSAEQATERAMVLIGRETVLSRAAIESGAPRSLAARAPWVMFVLLPIVLWIAILSAEIVWMMHLLWPMQGLAPTEMPASYRLLIEIGSFVSKYLVGFLLIAGCTTVAVRQRVSSGWIWVGLCAIALLTGILGIYMHVVPPQSGDKGSTVYSLFALVYVNGHESVPATLATWALHAAVLLGLAAIMYRALWVRFVTTSR
jgi:hypothetical protein